MIKHPVFGDYSQMQFLVLSHLMMYPDIIDKFNIPLKPDYFPHYRKLAEVILNDIMSKKSQLEIIRDVKKLDESYVGEMIDAATFQLMYSDYETLGYLLFENYLRYQVIEKSDKLLKKAKDETVTLDAIKSIINELSEVMKETAPLSKFVPASEIVADYLAGPPVVHYKTHISKLNELISLNNYLVLVGARPSVGKTAFGLSLGCHFAGLGLPVLFISYEMNFYQLASRLVKMLEISKVETSEENGFIRFNSPDVEQILKNFYFTESVPVSELKFTIEKFMQHVNIEAINERDVNAVIVVDYLQLIDVDLKFETREQEVAHISRTLKSISRDLNILVIALSQLRRSENERDPRPTLSDLRESGAQEQDSDIVILLHKPELVGNQTYYKGLPTSNLIEVIVAKNRHGRTGNFLAIFHNFDLVELISYTI